MKVINCNIFPFQEKDFLSPIRDKTDYARFIVCVARQLLLNGEAEGNNSIAKLKLVIEKMSRVFVYKKNKYFSVAYPFTVYLDNNIVTKITTLSGSVIDNMIISAIISILDSEDFRKVPSLVNHSFQKESLEYSGVFILEEILQMEPSYIRYDHDSENVNGKLHPLDHLDINYSQSGTFKLGLHKSINSQIFEDIQNIKTDCSYVVFK